MSVNRIQAVQSVSREDLLDIGKAIHDKLHDKLSKDLRADRQNAGTLEARLKALEEAHAKAVEGLNRRLEEREAHWHRKMQEQRDAHNAELELEREANRKSLDSLRATVKAIPTQPGVDGDGVADLFLRLTKMLDGKVGGVDQAVKDLASQVAELHKQFDGGRLFVKALVEALPPPQITVIPAEVRAPDVVVNVPTPAVTVDVKAPEINVPAPVVNVPEFGIPAPVVNVAVPEAKDLPAPVVNVSMPKRKLIKSIEYDAQGRPAQITETEVEDK